MGVGEASYILEFYSGYLSAPHDRVNLGFVYERLIPIFSFYLDFQKGFDHLDNAIYFPCLDKTSSY